MEISKYKYKIESRMVDVISAVHALELLRFKLNDSKILVANFDVLQ